MPPRRTSPRVRALTAVIALQLAAACGLDATQPSPAAYPNAGLYTPGNMLGVSDPADMPMSSAGLGNRCVALPPLLAGVPTSGVLTVAYQTRSTHGRYAPRNCTAVWIETAVGEYVATLELTAGLRRHGLVYFQDHACSDKLGPDAITSATRRDHVKPHMLIWSGSDFEGKPIADGPYKLFIEVTESDKEPGSLSELDFDKSVAAFEIDAPVDADGPLLSVKLKWKPQAEGSRSVAQGAK